MRALHRSMLTHLLLLAATSWFGVACSKIEIPLNLAVQPGSMVSIDGIPLPPPFDHADTMLVGGIETKAVVDIDPWTLFNPNGIMATIQVNDLLMAGDEIVFLGLIPTGTICIEPSQTPPGDGVAFLNLLKHQGTFHMDLYTQIRLTNQQIFDQVFGGIPLPFDATVDTTVPLTLSDLLGLLSGSGGLVLSQQLVSVLPPDVPIIGGATVTADVTLMSVDQIPTDPLLVDCVAP